MSYKSLRDFIDDLEARGELRRVTAPVSAHLEMTEIQTRLLAEDGPAVLFENPVHQDGRPAEMPVLANLFGTVARVASGMGREVDELRALGETLAFLRQPEPPDGWRDALDKLPLVRSALASRPKTLKSGPVQEVVLEGDDIDLAHFPIQTCWPDDVGPLISWPLVVTRGPSDDREDNFNLGIYRMQPIAPNKCIMRWLKHRGGAQHYARWRKQKAEPLPVAVVIGADPATILAAVTPVPDTMSEYQFSGLLRGSKAELVECRTVPIKVPAHAEIVLEGHVGLEEYADEGPYGDHTGYYNEVERFPVFTISAITMREKPIYLTTFTGRPPDEPSVLGQALNEIFLPLIRQQFPEIVDFYLPPEGCSYRIGVVAIKKAYPGHAQRIAMGVWSYLQQFTYTKWLIVIDNGIDCRNWADVMWAIATRMDPARDIQTIDRTPIDYLDFASPVSGLGSKAVLDATNKWPGETAREWGRPIRMDDTIIRTVTEKWPELGLPGSGAPIWKDET